MREQTTYFTRLSSAFHHNVQYVTLSHWGRLLEGGGAHWNRALINKINTQGGGLIRKGPLIGRRVLWVTLDSKN